MVQSTLAKDEKGVENRSIGYFRSSVISTLMWSENYQVYLSKSWSGWNCDLLLNSVSES